MTRRTFLPISVLYTLNTFLKDPKIRLLAYVLSYEIKFNSNWIKILPFIITNKTAKKGFIFQPWSDEKIMKLCSFSVEYESEGNKSKSKRKTTVKHPIPPFMELAGKTQSNRSIKSLLCAWWWVAVLGGHWAVVYGGALRPEGRSSIY